MRTILPCWLLEFFLYCVIRHHKVMHSFNFKVRCLSLQCNVYWILIITNHKDEGALLRVITQRIRVQEVDSQSQLTTIILKLFSVQFTIYVYNKVILKVYVNAYILLSTIRCVSRAIIFFSVHLMFNISNPNFLESYRKDGW